MSNILQQNPTRVYYGAVVKVTAFNASTKVYTIVSEAVANETYSVVTDKPMEVDKYYWVGLEERVYRNPDNSNAVTQFAKVISPGTSPPMVTLVAKLDPEY